MWYVHFVNSGGGLTTAPKTFVKLNEKRVVTQKGNATLDMANETTKTER